MPQRLGIVDLGSNTTRLVIYEYEPGRYFRLADEVREVVRLREGMGETNILRAAAIDRGLNALRMFHALCQALGVQDVTVVATSAVRDGGNRAAFLARAQAETGWKLRVLTGEEEGYYGALGAINSTGLQEGFVIDLGGGSLQVTEVREGLPGRCLSLPLGALRTTELFLGPDRVTAAKVAALEHHLAEQFAALDWFHARPGDDLAAIGGAIRNLAQIDQARRQLPLDTVQGYVLDAGSVHEIADQLWRLSLKRRTAVPGLNYDRADIIHAGALVYSALLRHSNFGALTVTRQGLREGVFYERFLEGQEQPIIPNLRQFSILSLARSFGYDNAHSHHVAHLALRLFDDLQVAHRLDPAYRQLLWAAGLLHDIGAAIDYQFHHLHSSYIILAHDLPGYSPRELALIALLCRYHRSKGAPKAGELAPLLAMPADENALVALAGMLRLAEYFERGRHQVIRDLRCHLDLAHGWLQIEALADGNAAMELWDAGRNTDVLAQALGLAIELVEGIWIGEPA
ncbi:MAG: Ppx/GppA family phosphatase [Caldilineales bacterium]|nr:Ppx/GppA family phosphatase [Caldilineales bacterium]MCW5857977.1 Ppx/GppA family phosphatase [Caldilineales bacterium]